jgi:hypothetical protein
MESAVRGARPQSGITSTPSRNFQLRLPKNSNCGCECSQKSRPTGPPGTEFSDAETGRQKSLLKRAAVRRDKSAGIEWPKVPAETPYLAPWRKHAVWKGWVVETPRLEPGTQPCSHRTSLPSTPGTGISQAETGARKGRSLLTETESETRRMPEKPHSGAISAS